MCKCPRARLPNSEAQITYLRDVFALQNDDSSSLYTISCPLDGLIMDCLAHLSCVTFSSSVMQCVKYRILGHAFSISSPCSSCDPG
jgi:hypothetical protein